MITSVELTNMKIGLLTLLSLTLLMVLVASSKVNGKAVSRRHSTRNDTDDNCADEINDIMIAFNIVKRDLEELKRRTDIQIKS